MPILHLSNGEAIEVDKDFDKLVKKVVSEETVKTKAGAIFTKHVLYVEK